jgi:hypothetical protein
LRYHLTLVVLVHQTGQVEDAIEGALSVGNNHFLDNQVRISDGAIVAINGRDIGEYGSQGENRLAALALKLSPYFLIEDRDKRPIIVLDDVMSELDQNHRQRLIEFLKKFEQVFITATRLEVAGANHYQIKKKK